MKLHAFGDSFTVGDQEDFDQYKDFEERLNYLRYNVSYISIVAKELNLELVNYAERGSGNFPQVDKLWLNLLNGNIKVGDIVFFCMSTSARDRSNCIELKKATSDAWGETVIDRHLLLSGDFQTLQELDYFYTISVLERIKQKFNVKVYITQAFDHCLDIHANLRHLFNTDGFIGGILPNTTLIDILNDTWGKFSDSACGPNHLTLTVPKGYESLYTADRHPSIEGHKKIAQWILKNIDLLS